MPSNTTRDVLAARKQTHAVLLKSLGFTYQAIADALLPCDDHRYRYAPPDTWGRRDCPSCLPMYAARSSAQRAVEGALEQEYAAGSETREQLRRHQLAQIDLLLTKAMVEAISDDPGHGEATRNAVRLMDRRAKLLGLDAPARVSITNELDQSIEALAEQLLQMGGGPVPTE